MILNYKLEAVKLKIKQIKIENYTVFQNQKMEFGDGINIFIGENGTGKTHLMKLLYSAAQSADPRISVAYKLVRTMLPDDYKIARLLTRRPGYSHANIKIVAQNEFDNNNRN